MIGVLAALALLLQRRQSDMGESEVNVFARSKKGNTIRLRVLQQAIDESGVNEP